MVLSMYKAIITGNHLASTINYIQKIQRNSSLLQMIKIKRMLHITKHIAPLVMRERAREKANNEESAHTIPF